MIYRSYRRSASCAAVAAANYLRLVPTLSLATRMSRRPPLRPGKTRQIGRALGSGSGVLARKIDTTTGQIRRGLLISDRGMDLELGSGRLRATPGTHYYVIYDSFCFIKVILEWSGRKVRTIAVETLVNCDTRNFLIWRQLGLKVGI